jgi:hypothetical protein
MLLQEQVIGSCDVVMLVGLYASLGILDIEVELFQPTQDLLIDGNSMIADNNAAV